MATKYTFTASEATRERLLLRAGFCGTTGAGKSLTAIKVGARMVEKMGLGPLYVVDTEHRSALRYAYSKRTGEGYRFKHVPMPEDDNSTDAYVAAVEFCEEQGAGVILIDSLSHMWAGIGGVLEQVDETTANSRTKNAFSEGWKKWTPIHARAIERIMQSSAHVLFTLRAKTDWQVVENEKGKKEPKKMGLAPVARDGIDYEPDLFFVMEAAGPETWLWVDKSRTLDSPGLARGAKHVNPGTDFADLVVAWVEDGEAAPPPPKVDALDARDTNARAAAWRTAIGAADIQGLDALTDRSTREPHPNLRADIGRWIAKRRATLLAPPSEPGDRPASPPPPNGAFLMNAAIMSDADRLRAIDQGRS